MSTMTIVQLGVLVFAICLSTQQLVSGNSTVATPGGNSTSNANGNSTTMAPDTYSSSANSTGPGGAGVSLHAWSLHFLIPVTVATSFLQRYC